MTARERSELQLIAAEVGRLANEQKMLNEKVSDLLEGRTANCATEAARIVALQVAQSRLEADLKESKADLERKIEQVRREGHEARGVIWARLWPLGLGVAGGSAGLSYLIAHFVK